MGVGDRQLDAAQTALEQALQEARPERLGVRGPEAEPDDLAPAFRIHGDRDYGGDRHDPAALAHLEVGRVQPEVRPLAFQGPLQEAADALVDVLAELRDGAPRDPRETHGLHQLVHPAGGHAADPRHLHDRRQRLLAHFPRLEKRREVGALAELGDTELERAQPGVERPVAVPVAVVQAVGGALVPAGADHPFDVRLHQQLQHRFRHSTQEVPFAGLLQQLRQWQSVLGHRMSLSVRVSLATPP